MLKITFYWKLNFSLLTISFFIYFFSFCLFLVYFFFSQCIFFFFLLQLNNGKKILPQYLKLWMKIIRNKQMWQLWYWMMIYNHMCQNMYTHVTGLLRVLRSTFVLMFLYYIAFLCNNMMMYIYMQRKSIPMQMSEYV